MSNGFIIFLLILLLKSLLMIVPILMAVAFLTLLERKMMGGVQRRRGPNIVGFFGLLQPFADGLKLLMKETIMPSRANKIIFMIAPIVTLFLSFLNWAIIPFNKYFVYSDINVGILYLFAMSSLGAYGIMMSGWSSNSSYAFLGTLSSAAQVISYEVSMGLILMNVLLCSSSLNLTKMVLSQSTIWYMFPLFPLFILFFLSALAETNRPPFDLPEAEAELVAGYFVEYSAMGFAQFFLGENVNIILMCTFTIILFLGGWLPPFKIFFWMPNVFWFVLKMLMFLFTFVWVRTTFPRYSYDQLMSLGWKMFLPLSLGFVLYVSGMLLGFNFLI